MESVPDDSHLEEGDLVQLTSGGPIMSLQSLAPPFATCIWFNGQGKLQEGTFPTEGLRKVERRGDAR